MSVIYLTQHDENIYDVIKPPQEKIVKPPPYVSSYNKRVKEETKIVRAKMLKYATMGQAEEPLKDPKNYLRKRTGKSAKTLGKPPKPPKLEQEAKIPKPEKSKPRVKRDYIRKNILEVKNVIFRPPEAKYADTRYGTTYPLEDSGFKLKYSVDKEKFGRPPNYLLKRMRSKEFHEKMGQDISEIESLPKCRYITRQERDALLNGLKKNWEEMQKEFQLLPMITDTIPKINRKVKLEKDLQALEKDIILIEKHPYIYIDETQDENQNENNESNKNEE